MQIEKISFKNFGSYGDDLTELEFKNNGEFYLISGKSGFGKTTIARVITYAIYGQCDIKQKSLINRINQKNLFVDIIFYSNNHKIQIQRGVKPNKFKAFVDDGEITDEIAGKGNIQNYLENEYFEIPYSVFRNIIVLSIVDFKSFLTMSPKDKRDIIDRLFGFTILNDMMEVLKKKKSELKKELSSIEGNLQSLEENRNNILSKLENIKESNDNNIKEQTELLKKELEENNKEYEKLQKGLKVLKEKESKLQSDYDELYNKLNGKYENLNYKKKSLKLYENNKCPECGSDLTTDDHKEKYQKIQKEVEELQKELEEEKPKIKKYKEDISKNREWQNKAIEKVSSIDSYIKRINNDLSNLNNNEDDKVKEFDDLLKDVNNSIKDKKELNKEKKKKEQLYYDVENIIGSGGIKKTAMEQLIPNLNKHVTDIITKLRLPFKIHFDNEFNAIVKQFGEEIDVKTLSHGQEKRMNLAIILSLLIMIMFKYPNLNIIFIDELLSSLDDENVEEVLNILSDFIQEYKLNAFVINHAPLNIDKFDWNINVEMEGGISYLTKEKI